MNITQENMVVREYQKYPGPMPLSNIYKGIISVYGPQKYNSLLSAASLASRNGRLMRCGTGIYEFMSWEPTKKYVPKPKEYNTKTPTKKANYKEREKQILGLLKEHGAMTVGQIHRNLGISTLKRASVHSAMSKLRFRNKVEKVAEGVYKLPDDFTRIENTQQKLLDKISEPEYYVLNVDILVNCDLTSENQQEAFFDDITDLFDAIQHIKGVNLRPAVEGKDYKEIKTVKLINGK